MGVAHLGLEAFPTNDKQAALSLTRYLCRQGWERRGFVPMSLLQRCELKIAAWAMSEKKRRLSTDCSNHGCPASPHWTILAVSRSSRSPSLMPKCCAQSRSRHCCRCSCSIYQCLKIAGGPTLLSSAFQQSSSTPRNAFARCLGIIALSSLTRVIAFIHDVAWRRASIREPV